MTTGVIEKKKVLRVFLGSHGIHAISAIKNGIRVYYFGEVTIEIRERLEQLAEPYAVEWKESTPAEASEI
jgi:hypothetical protein